MLDLLCASLVKFVNHDTMVSLFADECVKAHLRLMGLMLMGGGRTVTLSWSQCSQIWDVLMDDQKSNHQEREAAFNWFTENRHKLKTDSQEKLFKRKLLNVTYRTNASSECIKAYFDSVNEGKHDKQIVQRVTGIFAESLIDTKIEIEEMDAEIKILEENHIPNIESLRRTNEFEMKKIVEEAKSRHDRAIVEMQISHKEELDKMKEEMASLVSSEQDTKFRVLKATGIPSVEIIPECPVCVKQMRAPVQIFSCPNGHLVCGSCKPQIVRNKCAECRSQYMGRASVVENMVRIAMKMGRPSTSTESEMESEDEWESEDELETEEYGSEEYEEMEMDNEEAEDTDSTTI